MILSLIYSYSLFFRVDSRIKSLTITNLFALHTALAWQKATLFPGYQSLTPVILVTWEAKIGRIAVPSQPRQRSL
jgi:hypothetical protein